eukprot:363917-Chlamydomonas_euryale.AAC.12
MIWRVVSSRGFWARLALLAPPPPDVALSHITCACEALMRVQQSPKQACAPSVHIESCYS